MIIFNNLLANTFFYAKQCVEALVSLYQRVVRFFQKMPEKWTTPKPPEIYPKSYGLFSSNAPFFKMASSRQAALSYYRVQQQFNPTRCFS